MKLVGQSMHLFVKDKRLKDKVESIMFHIKRKLSIIKIVKESKEFLEQEKLQIMKKELLSKKFLEKLQSQTIMLLRT